MMPEAFFTRSAHQAAEVDAAESLGFPGFGRLKSRVLPERL